MNIEQLEKKIRAITQENLSADSFIYDLLLAYEQPKASITRLKKGDYNQSKNNGELLWKKKLCFRHEADGDLHGCIDRLKTDDSVVRHAPRFIVVTDFETLLAVDTKTDDTIDTPIVGLADHFDFFLPWAGLEKSQLQSENPADIKAAEKMGRLYELILVDNPADTEESRHALNIFLSRLLFCFFAEDTDIFESNQFTNAIASHTATNGSDLQDYLQKLFGVLSTDDRTSLPEFLRKFPYVNGGLFCEVHPVPIFNTKSRALIIECGSLNWKAINPDIFGSMIQAVVHTDLRGKMGMHYTSVVNIMKVIEPLFLNELRKQLEQAGTSKKRLQAILDRLYQLRIFDPACGSGNFLIIAYKELCRVEIEVFRRLNKEQQGTQTSFRFQSNIELTQFYGIELDDFAHETAKLSLWLAEHQMNLEFKQVFGATRPTLPLQDGGHIICGNATRVDWEVVCPKDGDVEIFVLGNPPYLGSRYQQAIHKTDIAAACGQLKNYKKVDYIVCWFVKAVEYATRTNCVFAFVSTNSVCQGEQVELIWPYLFEQGAEIGFAHQSFKWTNNARGNAGVTCVVIGMHLKSSAYSGKTLYSDRGAISAQNINAYLTAASNTIIRKRSKPLSNFPLMESGNKASDGGYLILSPAEREQLVADFPNSEAFLRRIYGAKEFLQGTVRWGLWIRNEDLAEAASIKPIAKRIELVRETRLKSKDIGANKLAEKAHQFREMKECSSLSLICPTVSSERRKYIPIGYLGPDDVIIAPNQAIYDPPPFMFAIISSRIHVVWVAVSAGRMKTDYRYSSALCYNTFPFPGISETQKTELEQHVFNVLDQRESFPERTLAELYDPDKMPPALRQAHEEMDLAVERCYRKKPFTSDEERLEYLFKLYEKMIEDEKNADA